MICSIKKISDNDQKEKMKTIITKLVSTTAIIAFMLIPEDGIDGVTQDNMENTCHLTGPCQSNYTP